MIKLREEWLLEVASKITPRIVEVAGLEMPEYRITCGWPSRSATSRKQRRIGECWKGTASTTGVTEMFISPLIADPMEVAATIAHELIHCVDKCKSGHKAPFARVARGIGLAGKPTATFAGDDFRAFADPILTKIGSYPHTAMKLQDRERKQGTRMMKVVCMECGYTARTTRVWLESYGPPLCPCNEQVMEQVS